MKLLKVMKSWITDKLNVKNTLQVIIELGKKHGKGFLIYAILIEMVEDLVIPAILISAGQSAWIPLILTLHLEVILYPAYFAVKKIISN